MVWTGLGIGLLVVLGGVLLLFGWADGKPRRAVRAVPRARSSRAMDRLLQESENICLGLSRNLEEKKEITQRLLQGMDARIRLLQGIDETGHPPDFRDGGGEDPSRRVMQLAAAGYSAAAIARRLNLPSGEVQLIFDLAKYAGDLR